MQPVASTRQRAALEHAAVDGDALPDAEQPVPAAVAAADSVAVVADGHLDVPVDVADGHVRLRRLRVLDRVRQAFLYEPVRGHVDSRRKLHRLAFDQQLDGQAGLARLGDELVDLLEARLGGERGRLFGPAEDADHSPHLGERLAPGLLDDEQRLELLLLVGPEQAAHGRCLHGHHADAVPDDVVELARDPRPLIGNGEHGLLLALLLRPSCQLLGLVDFPDLAAERKSDDPGDREGDPVPAEVSPMPRGIVARDDRPDADHECEAGDRQGPPRQDAEEEADTERLYEPDDVVRHEPAVDERARADGDADGHQRSDRVAPAREQREAHGEDGKHVEPKGPSWPVHPVMHANGRARDPGADQRHDQGVEPVAAREPPDASDRHSTGSLARSR
jgi:hypothetical protein